MHYFVICFSQKKKFLVVDVIVMGEWVFWGVDFYVWVSDYRNYMCLCSFSPKKGFQEQ